MRYPLTRASLIAQLVKNPLKCRRPRFDSSREDPLEKEKATHSSILACRILYMNHTVHGVPESDTTERLHSPSGGASASGPSYD